MVEVRRLDAEPAPEAAELHAVELRTIDGRGGQVPLRHVVGIVAREIVPVDVGAGVPVVRIGYAVLAAPTLRCAERPLVLTGPAGIRIEIPGELLLVVADGELDATTRVVGAVVEVAERDIAGVCARNQSAPPYR